jgi:TolA-binding protein
MKRTERRHLKENEIQIFARQAREVAEARRKELIGLAVALGVVAVGAIGYLAWRENVQSKAHALLADALAVQEARVGPPAAPGTPGAATNGLTFPTERERSQAALTKFKFAADKYPSSDAGIYARYEEASTEVALGNLKGAAATYQQVIDKAGNRIYGQMARLGLAETQARSGQYDQAINTFKQLSQQKEGPLPVDGILIELGRTYLDAGRKGEAQQTFNRLVQEYPESPFNADARRELDTLKKG